MAVLRPRERLVYFRVTEDEFHQFVSVCEQEGARSVSDLARNAVQRLIAECNRNREDREVTPKVEKLEQIVADLSNLVETLAALLKSQDGVRAGANGSEKAIMARAAETPARAQE